MGSLFNDFHVSMKKYLADDTFSDAIIKCNEREFKVHKIILASHSTFFLKMLTGGWKESSENVIELKEIECIVVEALLCFMYEFDYDCNDNISAMVFHAQVYSAAEQYGISALKTCARDKFSTAIDSGWAADDFPLAIAEVYRSTIDDDRTLRDLLVEISCEHLDDLLSDEGFGQALRTVTEFAAELLPLACRRHQKQKNQESLEDYTCNCGFRFCGSLNPPVVHGYSCPKCRTRRTNWEGYLTLR